MIEYTHTDCAYEVRFRTKTFDLKMTEREIEANRSARWTENPERVADIARAIFSTLDSDQEHLVVLVCNSQACVKGYKVISSGGMESAQADPRILFRSLLLLGAARFILVHNHPSGNLTPSNSDLEMTRSIICGAKVLGLDCLDHVIVTESGYLSMADRGFLPGMFASGLVALHGR